MGRARPHYLPDEIALAVLRLEQGTSLTQVALELKRDRTGLLRALRALGYPTRAARLSREERKNEVEERMTTMRALSRDEIKQRILELQRGKTP